METFAEMGGGNKGSTRFVDHGEGGENKHTKENGHFNISASFGDFWNTIFPSLCAVVKLYYNVRKLPVKTTTVTLIKRNFYCPFECLAGCAPDYRRFFFPS